MDRKIWSGRAALPLVLLTGLLVGQTNSAFADANGRAGQSGATASTCASCHSLTPSLTTVQFGVATGSFPTSVVANSVNVFTFTVSGGPAVNAGLDISASGGTLTATGAGTKMLQSEVVQSSPTTPFPTAGVVYSFTWTAPATAGSVTLYGAGVSGDGTGSEPLDGTATATATITVTAATTANVPPTAFFTGNTTGTVGLLVGFNSAGSTDADGTIAARDWNFGDGATTTGVDASGATATHTYAAAGTFPVKLTVTDNAGATNSITHDIVVSTVGASLAPVANPGGPYTGTAGAAVSFSGSASTVATAPAIYSWNFGDASTTSTSTLAAPTHTYAAAGLYLVTLTVTDSGTPPISSSVTARAEIAAATTTPPTTSTGQVLYDANCASCHGPKAGPAGADGSVVGESAGDIREAIAEVPTMQSLSTLTASEIFSIAVYLKPAPRPSRGERLYNKYCAECHGPGGTGADEPAIVGASAALIKDEVINEPETQYLEPLLDKEDAIQLIARFLGGAGVSRSDLQALPNTEATDDTFLDKKPAAKEPAPAAGALDWLTLIGVGAWGFSRRRKK